MSKIEWLARPGTKPETWNMIGGCSATSPGCSRCYAARLAAGRLRNHPRYEGTAEMKNGRAQWTGKINLDYEALDKPLSWRKPRTVFPCSMSDLFHPDVPSKLIKRDVWDVMIDNDRHTYMILTKRPRRMLELYGSHTPWPAHIWLGVTVENQAAADDRIPLLLQTPAAVRFVSCEPLLSAIDLRDYLGTGTMLAQDYLSWVIAGGETGPGARPMNPEWARGLYEQCQAAGVPFFFKSWGAWAHIPSDTRHPLPQKIHWWPDRNMMGRVGKKAAGHRLDGQVIREWPEGIK